MGDFSVSGCYIRGGPVLNSASMILNDRWWSQNDSHWSTMILNGPSWSPVIHNLPKWPSHCLLMNPNEVWPSPPHFKLQQVNPPTTLASSDNKSFSLSKIQVLRRKVAGKMPIQEKFWRIPAPQPKCKSSKRNLKCANMSSKCAKLLAANPISLSIGFSY